MPRRPPAVREDLKVLQAVGNLGDEACRVRKFVCVHGAEVSRALAHPEECAQCLRQRRCPALEISNRKSRWSLGGAPRRDLLDFVIEEDFVEESGMMQEEPESQRRAA